MSPTIPSPRLLVVEDDRPIGELLLEVLSDECGWSTTLVSSAAEARMAVAKETFDMMFVDYGLPDGNGLDLVRWVRSLPGDASPLACIVSALDREPVVREAIRDGLIHRFMAKPFDLDEIITTVREADFGSRQVASRNSTNGERGPVH